MGSARAINLEQRSKAIVFQLIDPIGVVESRGPALQQERRDPRKCRRRQLTTVLRSHLFQVRDVGAGRGFRLEVSAQGRLLSGLRPLHSESAVRLAHDTIRCFHDCQYGTPATASVSPNRPEDAHIRFRHPAFGTPLYPA